MESEPLVVERMFPEVGGQGVLVLKGPLTANNTSSFQNAVRRENARTLILDLTEVPYIDSSGLGSLVGAYVSSHKAGQQVVLTGVNDRVAKLFEISRLEPLFLIFPNLETALEALSNPGQA
jgi:anti-sigma B factor antagonist